MAPIPTPRSNHGVAVVAGKIYVIGGLGGNTTEMYDPETNSWTSKTVIPTSRRDFGIAVCQNKIYAIGGLVGALTSTGINEVYDPSTDTWERKSGISEPYDCLHGFNANVVNGKIYVISGCFTPLPPYINSAETLVYYPSNDSWIIKTPIPTPVHGYASAVIDNKIYVIGGRDIPSNTIYNLTQIYDTVTDTWSIGAPIPTSVYDAAAGATTGVLAPKRIYVLGGFNGAEALSSTFVYDPESNIWNNGTSLLTPRYAFDAAVVNDLLYTIGGYDFETNLAVNEKYTPIGYIPEFPSWTILLLFMTTPLIAIIFKKKVFHSIHY